MAQRDAVLAGAGEPDKDSVEAVHDLRVAIRRLRANFDAFRDAFPRQAYEDRRTRLRILARQLGEVRDADVMSGMLAARRAAAGERAELGAALDVLRDEALGAATRDRAERLEGAAGDPLAAAIADLAAFLAAQTLVAPEDEGLEPPAAAPEPPPPAEPRERRRRAEPDGPVGPGLWALLRWRLRRVRRADEAVPADPADPGHGAALHQLRIAIKRLRYLGEVAALVLGGEGAVAAAELLDRLADLQDELGEVHDADVLTELAAAHTGATGQGAAAGWTALAEDVAAEREAHRAKAEAMLETLRPDAWAAIKAPFRPLRKLS
jgi:CHAD domain-containing protein